MADELRLQIVLEDGSVKQGFLSIEKQADKTTKNISKKFDEVEKDSSESLSAIALRFAPIVAAATSAGLAIKKGLDFALLGEQVKAVDKQFDTLATSAGLASDTLKASIISATQGLIDDEDALKIATQSIVALGEEAARLPQVLDLARNASRALGKDFKDSFGQLSSFIENGNARVLRQFGIVLDLDNAYKKAAQSIGVTTAELTEQQKQTVRLNTLLGETANKFSATSQSVTPLKDALDRLTVSFGNLAENAAVKFNNELSPTLTQFINKINEIINKGPSLGQIFRVIIDPAGALSSALIDSKNAADSLANQSLENLRTKSTNAANEIAVLDEKISSLTEERKAAKGFSTIAGIDVALLDYKKEAESLRSELNRIDKEITNKVAQAGAVVPKDQPLPSPLTKTDDQKAKSNEDFIKKEQELTTFLFNEQLKRVNNEIQAQQLSLTNTTSVEEQKKITDQINRSQVEASEIQQNLNLLAIDKQFNTQSAADDLLAKSAREAAEQTHKDNLLNINKKNAVDQLALDRKSSQQKLAATSGFLGNLSTLQESSSKEAIAVGKAAALTQATIDGYTSIVGAYKSGAVIGGPALGAVFAAAAAAATAVQIGKIAAVGGGGGASYSPDTGGGIAAGPSLSTELTPQENLTRQEVGTSVQVTIQGDVLDSDESGSRIVNLINQAFDKKGLVLNQGVTA